MAQISISVFVDEDGNTRVEADDQVAFDNLDPALAVRKLVVSVDIPEPQAQEATVDVPAAPADPVTITVA